MLSCDRAFLYNHDMIARTIDQVIDALTEIVNSCRDQNSRLGYFPAMYRRVTIRIKEGLQAGRFENGERLEHLDVIFVNRYLDAYDSHRRGLPVTLS